MTELDHYNWVPTPRILLCFSGEDTQPLSSPMLELEPGAWCVNNDQPPFWRKGTWNSRRSWICPGKKRIWLWCILASREALPSEQMQLSSAFCGKRLSANRGVVYTLGVEGRSQNLCSFILYLWELPEFLMWERQRRNKKRLWFTFIVRSWLWLSWHAS